MTNLSVVLRRWNLDGQPLRKVGTVNGSVLSSLSETLFQVSDEKPDFLVKSVCAKSVLLLLSKDKARKHGCVTLSGNTLEVIPYS